MLDKSIEPVVPPGGKHLILDVYNCNKQKLDDPEFIIQTLTEAAIACGATVLKSNFVKFDPVGVTAFLILSESHISCHLWPESGYGAFDIFTCGSCDPTKAIEVISHNFETKTFSAQLIGRGNSEAK